MHRWSPFSFTRCIFPKFKNVFVMDHFSSIISWLVTLILSDDSLLIRPVFFSCPSQKEGHHQIGFSNVGTLTGFYFSFSLCSSSQYLISICSFHKFCLHIHCRTHHPRVETFTPSCVCHVYVLLFLHPSPRVICAGCSLCYLEDRELLVGRHRPYLPRSSHLWAQCRHVTHLQ